MAAFSWLSLLLALGLGTALGLVLARHAARAEPAALEAVGTLDAQDEGLRLGLVLPVIAAGLALWAAASRGDWEFWASCALGWTLLALALSDLVRLELPDELTLPLIPAGLAVAWLHAPSSLGDHVIGALAGFAAFGAVMLLYRRLRGHDGLGLGDAKLMAAAGAWTGWQALPSLLLLASLAALCAVAFAARNTGRALTLRSQVPLGVYLAGATWLVWLYGPGPPF